MPRQTAGSSCRDSRRRFAGLHGDHSALGRSLRALVELHSKEFRLAWSSSRKVVHHTRCHWRSPRSATNAKALENPTKLMLELSSVQDDLWKERCPHLDSAAPAHTVFSWLISGGFGTTKPLRAFMLKADISLMKASASCDPMYGSVDVEFTIYIYIHM